MFFILIIHEVGHLFYLIKYKREITNITFYPFGGIIKHSASVNSNLKEDFFIHFGGVFNNIILLVVFKLLNLELFYTLNLGILIFNILPIYPLDGFKIIKSLLNNVVCFKKNLYISLIISIIFIVLFTIVNICNIRSIYVYLLIASLIKMNIDYFKQIKKEYKIFLTNKYIYPNNKLKDKNIKKFNKPIYKLYKGKNNIFILDDLVIKEYDLLKKYFS